jgi:hypothetical protein
MDYRLIINEVRAALEEKAARELYNTAPAGQSAEQELADRVIGEALPTLRAMLTMLAELQQIWLAPGNDVPGKIAAAAGAGQPLAGYSPTAWLAWGAVLTALFVFLDTPITYTLPDATEITLTPRNALLTRYTREVQP